MASYKAIMNPFTGNLTLIRSDSAFHLKDSVNTYNDLPITGNTENDVRITEDTDKMYTWGITSSSGLLTDWKEIGNVTSVDWSAIDNGPSSTPAEIDSAVGEEHTHANKTEIDKVTIGDHDIKTDNPHTVTKTQVGLSNVDNKSEATIITDVKADSDIADAISKKHTQGTDQKLDEGGASEVTVSDVKDAVDKKHSQNTDTDLDATFEATFVKKVDTVNVLSDITSAGADIESAVSLKHSNSLDHTQDTDTDIILTEAPSNVSASGVKSTFTAGENLVFGEVGYIKSDGKIWKADATTIATAYVVVMTLATINAEASGSFLLLGIVRDDTWAWTVGGEIYLHTTAGEISQTAPSATDNAIIVVGIATHADRILFKPDLTIIEHA